MPVSTPPIFPHLHETNLTEAGTGVTVTAAASPAHTKGAWATIITDTSFATYGMIVNVRETATGAGGVADFLVDIGYERSAGGGEEVIIPNLNCGNSSDAKKGGVWFYFPVSIPNGVNVIARAQSNNLSATGVVTLFLWQRAEYPFVGGRVADYGTTLSTSRGTTVTRGDDVFGNWIEIGTTARAHRFWEIGMDGNGDTTYGQGTGFNITELGIAVSAGDVTRIAGPFHIFEDTDEEITKTPIFAYAPVPASTKIFARIAGGNNDDRGLSVYGTD